MSAIAADYYDGTRSVAHRVALEFGPDRLTVTGSEIAAEFARAGVRIAPRIADTPRWIYLPDGATCAVADNDAIDALAPDAPLLRLVRLWEQKPIHAVASVALVAALVWLFVDRGVPPLARRVAQRIPPAVEASLGARTLEGLGEDFMEPTQLPAERRAALVERFAAIAQRGAQGVAYRVEFRSSPLIGANAFALPGGIIIMTDELVGLAQNDDEVLGVLAHELGHVAYRHSMRRILETSLVGLVIASVTGDVSSMTSLAAGAPLVMIHLAYSRDHEREADRYAVELLRQSAIDPRHFSALLERIAAQEDERFGTPDFLSTHPSTTERTAAAEAGS